MNYYQYREEIVNENNAKDFYGKTNFIGYILPDGSIYSCNEHNMKTLKSYYDLIIYYLKNDYQNKDKFLGRETKDPVFLMFADFFINATYEEIVKFDNFVQKKALSLSDIIVSFFGCHLVTRLNKEILTSNVLHYPFYNYILKGFKIKTVPKIVYRDNDFCFYEDPFYNNDFLMDEIEEIEELADEDEKPLFFK